MNTFQKDYTYNKLIGKENRKGGFSIQEILQNQEEVFREFIGVSPSPHIRIKSPFRPDKRPDCRFKLFNNIWWLVDNATYKNKLYFNCIETVQYIKNIGFKEACYLIKDQLSLEGSYSTINIPSHTGTKIPIDIRFTYKRWDEDNYFTSKYNISEEYLNLQPYYNVDNYWCTTKKDNILKVNRMGIPKHRIAYYFKDTGHTKLYFPEEKRHLKWYANTSNEDIYGYHRMGKYLLEPDRSIFITGSGKDEMVLNYFTDTNSLGLQNETSLFLPNYLLRNLRYFDYIYVWLDADSTGIRFTKKLVKVLKSLFPTKKIIPLFHDPNLGKDIADLGKEMQYELFNYLKTLIWHLQSLKREI